MHKTAELLWAFPLPSLLGNPYFQPHFERLYKGLMTPLSTSVSSEHAHRQNKEVCASRTSQGVLLKKRGKPWKVPGWRAEDRPFCKCLSASAKTVTGRWWGGVLQTRLSDTANKACSWFLRTDELKHLQTASSSSSGRDVQPQTGGAS